MCRWENAYSVQILCPLFNQIVLLLLSCRSSLYFLNINLLTDAWFTNIFFHSVGCLFIWLTIFFVVQKTFSWMQSLRSFLLLLPLLLASNPKIRCKADVPSKVLKTKLTSYFKVFFKLIYFERVRENMPVQAGERQREGERESQAGSVQSSQGPTRSSIPRTLDNHDLRELVV